VSALALPDLPDLPDTEEAGTRKLTRTVRFEVRLADIRKADRQGKGAMAYRLAATAGALMEGSNRASFALASVFMGSIPWPMEPDPKNPGKERRVLARSLAYAAMSGKWQPYGTALYAPEPRYRVTGAVLSVQAGEILARLTGSNTGIGFKIKEGVESQVAKTHWWDTVGGRRSFPGFNLRRGGIPYRNDSLNLSRQDGVIVLTVWGQESTKGSRTVALRPWIRRDGSARTTLQRLRDGIYKQGGGCLTYDPKKKKWFLSIAWTGVIEELVPEVPRIAGVDVNVAKTAVAAFVQQAPPRNRKSGGQIYPSLVEAVGVPAGPSGFLPEGAFPKTRGGKSSPRLGWALNWLGIESFRAQVNLPTRVIRAWNRAEAERKQRSRWNREEFGLREGRGRQRKLRVTNGVRNLEDLTHTVIKQLVAAVVGQAKGYGSVILATEDLQHWSVDKAMLESYEQLEGQARKAQRKWYLRWHQGLLREQFASVSTREGMVHLAVDPRYSSWICAVCGRLYTESVYEEAQDSSKAPKWGYFGHLDFRCACGWTSDGDRNAALVLARRARGELSMIGGALLPMDKKAVEVLAAAKKAVEAQAKRLRN